MMRSWNQGSIVSFAALSLACGEATDDAQSQRFEPQRFEQPLQAAVKGAEDEAQPLGRVFSADMVKGEARYLSPSDLSANSYFTLDKAEREALDRAGIVEELEPLRFEGELHPRLLADVERFDKGSLVERRVEVVITFKQRSKVPRFPQLNELESRDSAENKAVLRRSEALVSSIVAARAPVYDARKAALQKHGVLELERFWLIDGMLASVPLGKLRGLARHPDVQYVEYNQSDAPPPVDNVPYDARFRMGTDVYYGFTGGYIGMLDTGVRNTHTLFNNPSRIAIYRDCNSGLVATCSGPTPSDCMGPGNAHGTSSASVISGNNNWGDPMRGISQVTIDSFKVYDNTFCGYSVAAGERGFKNALALGDKVIMANIQEIAGPTSATSVAANAAYDAGAVVIAAAGNRGENGASSVTSPGNATKVLTVGAVGVASGALKSYSGRGPIENRTKPDVTAPTDLWAAGNASDSAFSPDTYGGTSCATPSATGAAAVARNFLRGANPGIDPGQVYAFLIMTGRNFTSPATDNSQGAGELKLYTGDTSMAWGAVSLAPNTSTEITVNRSSWPAGTNFFDAAIWWPQGTIASHVNINLRVIRPNGSFIASESANSVFEKVRITSSAMPTGNWKIRISNTSLVTTQTVYWARRYTT